MSARRLDRPNDEPIPETQNDRPLRAHSRSSAWRYGSTSSGSDVTPQITKIAIIRRVAHDTPTPCRRRSSGGAGVRVPDRGGFPARRSGLAHRSTPSSSMAPQELTRLRRGRLQRWRLVVDAVMEWPISRAPFADGAPTPSTSASWRSSWPRLPPLLRSSRSPCRRDDPVRELPLAGMRIR